jgi:hypothetical protein
MPVVGLKDAIAGHAQEVGDREQQGIVVTNDDAPPVGLTAEWGGTTFRSLDPAETAGLGGY